MGICGHLVISSHNNLIETALTIEWGRGMLSSYDTPRTLNFPPQYTPVHHSVHSRPTPEPDKNYISSSNYNLPLTVLSLPIHEHLGSCGYTLVNMER
jgi:hypothetical protein